MTDLDENIIMTGFRKSNAFAKWITLTWCVTFSLRHMWKRQECRIE